MSARGMEEKFFLFFFIFFFKKEGNTPGIMVRLFGVPVS